MCRRLLHFFVFIVSILIAIPAFAVEFQPLGFEASSMGGAGVASARGSYAPYYNPALLAEHKHGMQISISAGVGVREVNISDSIDTLSEIDIDDTLDEFASNAVIGDPVPPDVQNDIAAITDALTVLTKQNGVQLMPSANLGMQMGNYGFGVYGVSEATAIAIVDPNRLDFIVEEGGFYLKYDESTGLYDFSNQTEYEASSLEYAIDQGLTYLELTGLAYLEVPIAYGRSFPTSLGKLNCGISFKIMPAYTYDLNVKIDTESDDISDAMKDAEKRDTGFGVDFGLLYKPPILSNFSLGLVAKNINTPEFETIEGDTLEVKPQVRAGLACDLLGDILTLAIDADLTSNETFIPDYESQFIGGGVNFHPFSWLSLRGGAMSNTREKDEGIIWTAGLGFGLKWFQLDLSAQYSSKEGEFDGTTIPRYGRAQVSIVSKWF
jgi:hypothetical protein